jgi:acetyl-CoA C-acetyltransferase
MNKKIYILGGSQTDFAVNWSRSEKTLYDLFSKVVLDGLESAKMEAKDIDFRNAFLSP